LDEWLLSHPQYEEANISSRLLQNPKVFDRKNFLSKDHQYAAIILKIKICIPSPFLGQPAAVS